MKKKIFVLFLALCFCLSAACSAEEALRDITESLKAEPTAEPVSPAEPTEAPSETAAVEQPAADDSGTDAYAPGEAGFVDDSGTDTPDQPAQTDWTALSADQCIEDAWPEEGVLPRIILDCEGADEINAQLEDFTRLADDPMCEQLYYQCSKGASGRVLSILMVQHGPNDTVFYTVFNLDVVTGQALSGQELLALLGVDETELANLEQAVMGEEFVHQFGLAEDQTDPDFYNEQYARTTASDNADTDRVWIAGDGQLCFIGRIYPLAGAEYYEYILGSTLFYG